jgi:putative hydrolase of the HAD superfamily
MIKAVIFDLDNTIVDFMRMKKVSCEEAVDSMIDAGLKLSKKKALDELYKIYYEVGLEDPTIFQKFLKKVTGKIDYKILSYGIVAYRRVRSGFLHPYPGTRKTLIKIKEKGLKLAIVSDAPKLKAWIRLTTMKLDDFFDVVIGLEDTGKLKPAKQPFALALKQLNLKPEECLMIGDNPSRDMKGARAIGIKTAFAKYGCTYTKYIGKWDYELKKIEDLVRIIK